MFILRFPNTPFQICRSRKSIKKISYPRSQNNATVEFLNVVTNTETVVGFTLKVA